MGVGTYVYELVEYTIMINEVAVALRVLSLLSLRYRNLYIITKMEKSVTKQDKIITHFCKYLSTFYDNTKIKVFKNNKLRYKLKINTIK